MQVRQAELTDGRQAPGIYAVGEQRWFLHSVLLLPAHGRWVGACRHDANRHPLEAALFEPGHQRLVMIGDADYRAFKAEPRRRPCVGADASALREVLLLMPGPYAAAVLPEPAPHPPLTLRMSPAVSSRSSSRLTTRRRVSGRRSTELCGYLGRRPWDWEVRVVDDGSADGTARRGRAGSLRREPRIVLQREPHRGKGGAVKAGLLAARGDFRFICDADLSMPVAELAALPAADAH